MAALSPPMVMALVVLMFAAHPLLAEQEATAAADEQATSQQLIRAAYEKTQSAETVEQYTEVVELCEQALAAARNQSEQDYVTTLLAWTYNRRGEAYVEQAAALVEQDDVQQAAELDSLALADFETAVELDPQRWKAIHNRGVSYALAGQYEQAVEDFSRVLNLKQDYANAWFNRGEIRYELGQFQQAVSDYNRALGLRPNDHGTYTSRAHSYFRLGRFRNALQDYSQAVRLASDNAEVRANRADAYQSLGLWAQAAADYRQAINLDRRLGRAYQGAAWLMATCPEPRFRNPERALQAAQRAIELDQADNDYRYLDTLAACYASLGQFEQARATQEKALETAPEDQVEALQRRLQRYTSDQPYRQPAPRTR